MSTKVLIGVSGDLRTSFEVPTANTSTVITERNWGTSRTVTRKATSSIGFRDL
jgi:hypothetical protein